MLDHRLVLCLVLALGASTCGPEAVPSDSEGTHSTSGTTSASTSASTSATSIADETADLESGTPAPDMGVTTRECDIRLQDCPAGYKCNWKGGPRAQSEGCVPIAEDPGQAGDPCTFTEPIDGTDSCDEGLVCGSMLNREPRCRWICEFGWDDPCSPPETACLSASDYEPLYLCEATCDPLVQDCDDGYACQPKNHSFFCFGVHITPPADGTPGAECGEDPGECLQGTVCLDDPLVPDCGSPIGCCSALCDPLDPGATPCLPGQVCTSWSEIDSATVGFDHVGVCSL